jgi:acetyltransferase-like isoleucine patch superfamily enzyme
MNSDYLSRKQLEQCGFADLGEHVLLHSSCVIVGAERISIGSHVRIDPFCIITMSGQLQIGSRVHLSGHVAILGAGRIEIGDFAAISHGAKILSSSDSFSAGCIAGPMVPEEFRGVMTEPVFIGRHAVVGANAVVLPGATIGEGATIGALSMVKSLVEPWTVNAGIPIRVIAHRDRSGTIVCEQLFADREKAALVTSEQQK